MKMGKYKVPAKLPQVVYVAPKGKAIPTNKKRKDKISWSQTIPI
jgi:hypothetical protein